MRTFSKHRSTEETNNKKDITNKTNKNLTDYFDSQQKDQLQENKPQANIPQPAIKQKVSEKVAMESIKQTRLNFGQEQVKKCHMCNVVYSIISKQDIALHNRIHRLKESSNKQLHE
ncbi:hypothetical protein NEOKW01_0191 [Nematocida sp. AWRm80]|nr:hypothetical protein NEOKW01_0191 [Nematocida sp. AWRm80]